MQQAVHRLKLVAPWCMPHWPVPYLSIVQLRPVSRLCRTTGHGGPHGGHTLVAEIKPNIFNIW